MNTTKRRVLEALLSIIDVHGIDGVTIRAVAARSELSIGTVQYYGRTKTEMLSMGFDYVIDSSLQRVESVPDADDTFAVLRRAVFEFMALDARRCREIRVYLAYATRAAVDARFAEMQHAVMDRLRRSCGNALRIAGERGQADGPADAERFAAATVAIVDGVNLQLLSDPTGLSVDDAVAIVDDHLARYFSFGGAGSTRSARYI